MNDIIPGERRILNDPLIKEAGLKIELLQSQQAVWQSPTCPSTKEASSSGQKVVRLPLHQRSESDTCSCCLKAALGVYEDTFWFLFAALDSIKKLQDPELKQSLVRIENNEKQFRSYLSVLERRLNSNLELPDALEREMRNLLNSRDSLLAQFGDLKKSEGVKRRIQEEYEWHFPRQLSAADESLVLLGTYNFTTLVEPTVKAIIDCYSIFENDEDLKVALMPTRFYELIIHLNKRGDHYFSGISSAKAPKDLAVCDTAARLWTPHQKKSIFSDLKVALETAQAL